MKMGLINVGLLFALMTSVYAYGYGGMGGGYGGYGFMGAVRQPTLDAPYAGIQAEDLYQGCKYRCGEVRALSELACFTRTWHRAKCAQQAQTEYQVCVEHRCGEVLAQNPVLRMKYVKDCFYYAMNAMERKACPGLDGSTDVDKAMCKASGCCFDEFTPANPMFPKCFAAEVGVQCTTCCGGCQNKYVKDQVMCPGDPVTHTRAKMMAYTFQCGDGMTCKGTTYLTENYESVGDPYCCDGFTEFNGRCRATE